jgi:putative oxidoreductase
MVSAAKTAGGILLLGLLTPLAACAVIAAMTDAWTVLASGRTIWFDPFDAPFMMVFAATALLFTGAGGYSLDERLFGTSRWPALVTVALFVVAVAAADATWISMNGTNPIHVTASAA